MRFGCFPINRKAARFLEHRCPTSKGDCWGRVLEERRSEKAPGWSGGAGGRLNACGRVRLMSPDSRLPTIESVKRVIMSSQEYDETKLSIPFPSASSPTTHLSGILHQKKQPSQPTSQAGPRTRPLVLILHGVLAHKDQTYHRLLAKRLDVDSLRFDFRGNGESGGEWGMADYEVSASLGNREAGRGRRAPPG